MARQEQTAPSISRISTLSEKSNEAKEPEAPLGKTSFLQKTAKTIERKRWILYVIKAATLLGAFYAAAQAAPRMQPVQIALLWTATSAISSIGITYHTTIRKTLKQFAYQKGGKLSWLNDGRGIAVTLGIALSAFCTASLILEAPQWSPIEWGTAIALIPLYAIVYILTERYISHEYTPLFRKSSALRLTRIIVMALVVITFAAMLVLMPADNYSSLEEALASAPQPYKDSPTAVMVELCKLTNLVDGVTAYAASEASRMSFIIYFIIRIALVISAFFGIVNLLSICALEPREMLRAITSLSTEETMHRVLPLKKLSVAWAALLLVVFVFGGFLLTNEKIVEYENSNGNAPVDAYLDERKK